MKSTTFLLLLTLLNVVLVTVRNLKRISQLHKLCAISKIPRQFCRLGSVVSLKKLFTHILCTHIHKYIIYKYVGCVCESSLPSRKACPTFLHVSCCFHTFSLVCAYEWQSGVSAVVWLSHFTLCFRLSLSLSNQFSFFTFSLLSNIFLLLLLLLLLLLCSLSAAILWKICLLASRHSERMVIAVSVFVTVKVCFTHYWNCDKMPKEAIMSWLCT